MKIRNKLMVTSIMLVVSILMMSTVSYAWFTISTAPEISGLKTDVVVNDNLEIALAGTTADVPGAPAADQSGKVQTSWGNVIDLTSTDVATTYNNLEQTLRPAQLNSGSTGFEFPQYGADGRITSFAAMTEDTTYQFGNLKDGKSNIYGYYIDLWLRTNVAGDIALSTTGIDRGTEVTGSGSYISTTAKGTASQMYADSLQVAFEVLGSSTPTYTTGSGALTYPAITAGNGTITKFTKAANGTDKYDLSGTVITGATVNTAYLVRVYVYLDGTTITNAGASTVETALDGTLNIQFVHSKNSTFNPMDMPNDVPNAPAGT